MTSRISISKIVNLKPKILVLIGLIISILLRLIPQDCFQQIIDPNYPIVFRLAGNIILAATILLIIYVLLYVIPFIRKRTENSTTSQGIISIITISIIFGYFSQDGLTNLRSFIIGESQFKTELCSKLSNELEIMGSKGEDLSYEEYKFIRPKISFPKISSSAYDIKYIYSHDTLLPDFHIEIKYKVPFGTKIKTFNEHSFQYQKSLDTKRMKNHILVTYLEYQS